MSVVVLRNTEGATIEPTRRALNVGRFAGRGVGNAPKHPIGFCGSLVPKRPTSAVTTYHLPDSAPIEPHGGAIPLTATLSRPRRL